MINQTPHPNSSATIRVAVVPARPRVARALWMLLACGAFVACGGDDVGSDAPAGNADAATDESIFDARVPMGDGGGTGGMREDAGDLDSGVLDSGGDAGAAGHDAEDEDGGETDADVEGDAEQGDADTADSAAGDACEGAAPLPSIDETSIALSFGHVDAIAVFHECSSGALEVATKDDSAAIGGARFRDVAQVLIHGNAGAAMQVPEGLPPQWSFVGAPGSTVWILPEVQIESVVWPGWDSNGVEPGVYDGDTLELRLNSVDGPGRFIGYVDGPTGSPLFIFDPENDLMSTTMHSGSHVHLNWLFSEPGLYKLAFAIEGTKGGGATMTTSYLSLRFFLGELSDLPATEPTVIDVQGLMDEYTVGDALELSATIHGAPSALPITWLMQCQVDESGSVTSWTTIGTGPSLSRMLEDADRNCQYRAVLRDGDIEVATSQALYRYVSP